MGFGMDNKLLPLGAIPIPLLQRRFIKSLLELVMDEELYDAEKRYGYYALIHLKYSEVQTVLHKS